MDSLSVTDAASAAVAVAPRVSKADIEAKIVAQHFFQGGQALVAMGHPIEPGNPLDLLTICLLVTQNGFVFVGKSAPASAANFDAKLGRQFAYEDAFRQIWPMEGYALRERLATSSAASPAEAA